MREHRSGWWTFDIVRDGEVTCRTGARGTYEDAKTVAKSMIHRLNVMHADIETGCGGRVEMC